MSYAFCMVAFLSPPLLVFPSLFSREVFVSFEKHVKRSESHQLFARIEYGEDLLGSLQRLCMDNDTRNGVIVSDYGTLCYASFLGLQSTEYPPPDFYRWRKEEGYEVLNFAGVMADYRVHAHLTFPPRRRLSEAIWEGVHSVYVGWSTHYEVGGYQIKSDGRFEGEAEPPAGGRFL